MPYSRRQFAQQVVTATGTLAVASRGILLAQRPVTAEEAAEHARRAIAQQKAALELVRIAHVAEVSGNVVRIVNDRGQWEDLVADNNVRVWKGRYFRGTSQLQPSDRIMVRGRKDPATGKLIATEIWINWDSFSGTITAVRGTTFDVQLDRRNVPSQTATVSFGKETNFVDSAAEDLLPGRPVTIAGVTQKDGSLLATTITVFDVTGRPVRMNAQGLVAPREK